MRNRFKTWKYPIIIDGEPTKYNWVVSGLNQFKLGYKTDIGVFSFIHAKYGVEIDNYVQLGSHCSVYSESTIDDKKGKVILKENCRIGSHSTIMPGVIIGKNSVIGAHSFVNKSIPVKIIKKVEK